MDGHMIKMKSWKPLLSKLSGLHQVAYDHYSNSMYSDVYTVILATFFIKLLSLKTAQKLWKCIHFLQVTK